MQATDVLCRAGAWYASNRFWSYSPTVGMAPFHESSDRLRIVRAPNQVSKTYAGAVEAWSHLCGLQIPGSEKPAPTPSSGWVMIADYAKGYPIISEKLYMTCPTDHLDPASRYIQGKGWYTNGRQMIRSRAGTVMEFRSGESTEMAAESGTVGWAWVDEPPKELLFEGLLMRVAKSLGPVWVTLTPIGRPCGWLRERVEGNPKTKTAPAEHWAVFRPRLTEEECTTLDGRVIRTAESIRAQETACSPWTRAQRIEGEWDGPTGGRRYAGFSESCVLSDRLMPTAYDEIRIGIDHGEGDFREYFCVVGVIGNHWFVIREWGSEGVATPAIIASALIGTLRGIGLSVSSVHKVYGDVNSAGIVGGGGNLNGFVEAAIQRALSQNRPPVSIETPWKGKGSVEAGESAINTAYAESRLSVSDQCPLFIETSKHYSGREKVLKDRSDAVRYALSDLILEATSTSRFGRIRR